MRRLEWTRDALRPSYQLGLGEARRSPATWTVLGALIIAGVASFTVAAVMWGVPWLSGPMLEPAVPDGPWAFVWGGNALPPAVEQQEQLRALRGVGAGAATLLGALCLLTVAGLWRQRLLLRRDEDFVHWAVGARKLQIVARWIGEARFWLGAAAGFGSLSAAVVAAIIERSFPGSAPVGPNAAAASLLLVAISVVLMRWEGRAGIEAHEAPRGRFWEAIGSPPMIGAVGFAALSGVGLLVVHAPFARSTAQPLTGSVTPVSLAALPPGAREERIREWTGRVRAGGAEVGFASAGTVRGTGHVDYATVECGRCFQGLMPMPLKVARAEVHAVAPDTFPHLALTVTGGRDFDDADRGDPSVAIVSRALANGYFERGEPLGRRLRVGGSGWLTIVGIVEGEGGLGDRSIYVPLAQAEPAFLEVLSSGSSRALQSVLDRAPSGVEIGRPRSLREVFSSHRWFQWMSTAMGAAAVVLLGAGMWISAANEAGAARYEVAVRRAVGATRRSFWTFYGAFAGRRLAFALGIGAWLSLFLGAGLEMAYATIPRLDWRIWGAVALWVASAYVLGSLRPMLRAAREPLTDALQSSA
ncbi:MAG: ABC transporter permease [Gemmatimonadales bacterium]